MSRHIALKLNLNNESADIVMRVPSDCLRLAASGKSDETNFDVGDKVEGNYKG